MDKISSLLLLVLLASVRLGKGATFDPHDLESMEPQLLQKVHYGTLGARALRSLFNGFIKEHKKVYASHAEKEKRMNIFFENLKRYDAMNAAERGTAVYGVDEFSDLTGEEFKNKMMTLNVNAFKESAYEKYDDTKLHSLKIPKNFDWREKGAVTPIKDQGFCGSCWAFSAVCNLEGLYFKKNNELITFSEQQLVDCDTESYGCGGGWMESAINYIQKAGGLQTNSSYPYTGYDGQCKFDPSLAVLKVKSNIMLPKNERKIAAYLFKNGPVSIALDASAMNGYKGGIAHPSESFCSKNETLANHGIALVGYGVKVLDIQNKKKRVPFWIAKNSWGPKLCDRGYYYVYRGDNTCGLANYASSAVLA